MTLGAETMAVICYDVQRGRAIAESRLEYTNPMKKFRALVEAEWEAWSKEHPEHILTVPSDLPSADIKVPKPSDDDSLTEASKFEGSKSGDIEPLPLTEGDRLALRALPLTEKGKDSHFYGPWAGGSKAGGGGPDKNRDGKAELTKEEKAVLAKGNPYDSSSATQKDINSYRDALARKNRIDAANKAASLDDQKGALALLGPAGSMKDGQLHIAGKPATPAQVADINKTMATQRAWSKDKAAGAAQADAFTKGLPLNMGPNASRGDKSVAAASKVSPNARRAFVKANKPTVVAPASVPCHSSCQMPVRAASGTS